MCASLFAPCAYVHALAYLCVHVDQLTFSTAQVPKSEEESFAVAVLDFRIIVLKDSAVVDTCFVPCTACVVRHTLREALVVSSVFQRHSTVEGVLS